MISLLDKLLRYAIAIPAVLLLAAWSAAAVWFDGPASLRAPGVLPLASTLPPVAAFAAVPPIAAIAALLRWRAGWRGIAAALLAPAIVIAWWDAIPASNSRDWLPDVVRLPVAEFSGDTVTIRNVRNFDYRSETDFTERWEERTYDLDQIVGIDFYLSYWGSPWIAHTIVSWEFADGRYLAISIETRKEKGESYSAVLGFFRAYELYYVVADERDVIRVRTNDRGEEVHLYRLKTPPATSRALLVNYLEEVNRLVTEPTWYNAMTHNCTTTIRKHAQHVAPGNPFDWRILVNGKLDELGYERGVFNTSMSFEEARRRSDITERAKAADTAPNFSQRIREGLPPRPTQ